MDEGLPTLRLAAEGEYAHLTIHGSAPACGGRHRPVPRSEPTPWADDTTPICGECIDRWERHAQWWRRRADAAARRRVGEGDTE
jgi:hypothetical protein